MSRRKLPQQDSTLYTLPALYDLASRGVPGDCDYFAALASNAKQVLELGCGSGRVTLAMARAGAKVTGVDLSPDMLGRAAGHLEKEPPEIARHIRLFEGDMRAFDAKRRFPLIVIPYRAFQHLHEVPDQRACLECCREHLTAGGRLVIDLFDPNLRILADSLSQIGGSPARKPREIVDPQSGERVVCWVTRTPCPEEQRFTEEWIFERFGRDGRSLSRQSTTVSLRYFYRYEMEHLFELCGLEPVKLEGDFFGGPYRHGGEQLWTLRRARK